MSKAEGGCGCGKVRYEVTLPALFVHCCHCLDCQRQTGSAFALNALIESDRVEQLSGDLKWVDMPTESGRKHLAARCADCGTALWSDYGGRGYMVFLRVGTLDNPLQISPDVHIFTRSKHDWVKLDPDLPSFEAFYPDMRDLWPEAALKRRKAASDKAKAAAGKS